jgi:hypothetical protein
MKPLESRLEAQVKQYAESKDCLFWKFSSPARRGVPDRIIITPHGAHGWMELKRDGESPTSLQFYHLRLLREHRAPSCWVSTFEQAKDFIDELLSKCPSDYRPEPPADSL